MQISLRNVEKTYRSGGQPFTALRDVDLDIDAGELAFVVGRSGSGKSTLLNMVGGLDRPTRGTITVAGTAVHELGQDSLARFRGSTVGVVFQFFQLLPTLTVVENLMLAMDFVGTVAASERRPRAMELLDRVGVREQATKLPAALSGGEQQRVAIARALTNDPPIIVADEPTGNLDSGTSARVMELFAELAAEGKAVLLVTHDPDNGVKPARVITMVDGRIV